MSVDQAYSYLFGGALIIIGICLLFVIIKSIIGPRISDRMVTINMIGTLATTSIAILSCAFYQEQYLIDICIIYVILSFLAVIVFVNVFINQYINEKKNKNGGDK